MLERGIMPFITLHHFTDPLWLTDRGGWEDESVVPLFEKFVREVVEALKEYCTLWCTLNEPNGYALNGYVGGGLSGNFPPGRNSLKLAMQVQANLIRGHAAAYRVIHQIQPEARVGMALHYRAFAPHYAWSPVDKLLTKNVNNMLNNIFPSALASGVARSALGTLRLPEAKGTQDYFGFNYYTKNYVTLDLTRPETMFSNGFYAKGADLSDNAFLANEPSGMFEGLKWVVRTFPGLPIIVSENGFADAQDRVRPRYLAQHIQQMWRAVNFNYPVKGYYHWSLVDNFEWDHGWSLRFGLWELNPATQARTRRRSADFYADICKENGLSTEMVAAYCPEVLQKMFPG
jgi:beta-glucosidase